MALTEIGGGGINYIQSTAPSSPEDKEIWIDVSSSPPLVKVYDADNSTWESATNVLSDGTRFDGANIDAAISSVGGEDWASKTPDYVSVNAAGNTTINGSGYLVNLQPDRDTTPGTDLIGVTVDIDGSSFLSSERIAYRWETNLTFLTYFSSSLYLEETEGDSGIVATLALD